MKSTKIRLRNIPKTKNKIKSVHLKPIGFLIFLMCAGIIMLFYGKSAMAVGIWLIIVSLFSIVLMPDRLLISYSQDYLILHDRHDKEQCWLIYWPEIVNWNYEKHKTYDQLIIHMSDGRTHSADAFSRRLTARIMNTYAPGKEMKNTTIGKV